VLYHDRLRITHCPFEFSPVSLIDRAVANDSCLLLVAAAASGPLTSPKSFTAPINVYTALLQRLLPLCLDLTGPDLLFSKSIWQCTPYATNGPDDDFRLTQTLKLHWEAELVNLIGGSGGTQREKLEMLSIWWRQLYSASSKCPS
jgi:hypothetical protein